MKPREVQVRSYTRRVKPVTVEFICHRCQRPQRYTMYPGPLPKWCLECFPEIRREQARVRKRRQRAKDKQDAQPEDN